MLLPRVVAAVCAADNTEEKKPEEGDDEPALPDGPEVEGRSSVGVGGARTELDSLLGPAAAEPARSLRWVAIRLGVEEEEPLFAVLGGLPVSRIAGLGFRSGSRGLV